MAQSAFVIGGTGLVGSAIVRRLADHGWDVAVAARGERDRPAAVDEATVRVHALDRSDTDALRAALDPGTDVLIDVVSFSRVDADQLVGLRDLFDSLVVISSAAVYTDREGREFGGEDAEGFPRFPVPIDERQPTVAPGDDGYAAGKSAMERTLLGDDGLRATVIRPGAIYGRGDQAAREWFFVKRAADGRRVAALAYRGSSRFHPTAVDNLAELVRLAAQRPGSRVLNCGDPDPPTALEIGRAVARALDHEFTEVLLPGPPIEGVGAHPWAVPRPVVLSMTDAEIELGYRPVVRYERAVAPVCEWLLDATRGRDWREVLPKAARYYSDLFDYAREDAFLAGLGGGSDQAS